MTIYLSQLDLILSTVLPKITSSFKDVLSCFKKNRKHLPRDSDLKSILRTQRAIFISSMEIWQSKYGSGKCYSASSSSECFQVALAVRAKLKEIEGIAGRLPFGVDSIISRGGAYTLKVLNMPRCFFHKALLSATYTETD